MATRWLRPDRRNLPVQLVALTLCLALAPGCGLVGDLPFSRTTGRAPDPQMRQSVIDRLQRAVRPEMSLHLGHQETLVLGHMAEAQNTAAHYKAGLAVQGLSDPWTHLATLERHGLLAAEMAEGSIEGLPALLDILEAGVDRTAVTFTPRPFPTSLVGDELLEFFTDMLQQAYEDREKALRNLSQNERLFLYAHAATLVEEFVPHLSEMTVATERLRTKEVAFARLLMEQVDYAHLIVAAQRLARLGNETFLRRLAVAFSNRRPLPVSIPGITGDVLFARETSYGLVVIGGTGPNSYDLDGRFSLVIDLGGPDTYRGAIGASENIEVGHSVVIDLGGHDRYESSPLGLATGRLGVGVVIDLAGDDVYRLAPGSGGTGFAGLGILYDGRGHDRYLGSRFTQGAAFGGLGLLVDRWGDDRYTVDGYGIGLGSPLGVGAVIDVEGNDTYRCGGRYPSAYNEVEQPAAEPGSPGFQYDCFGLGAGTGSRVLGSKEQQAAYNTAGGWGLLIDVAGQDQYHSDNFSQGVGYFFGIGVKLDLDGDDVHRAARYGHGAAAHYGVGLLIDRHGDDRYESSGPFYNGGAAWDSSAALMIDAGSGNDQYLFALSTGLGIADHGAWAACIDEAGADRYLVGRGHGWALNGSLAGFLDLVGQDRYQPDPDPTSENRGDTRTFVHGDRGMFFDQ